MSDRQPAERAGRRIAGAAAAIALVHLSARILGFAEKILSGRYFGTSTRADAYVVASKVPSTIFSGCEKILNPSFIPTFIDVKEKEGEDAAWRLTGTTLVLQAAILVVLAFGGRASAHWLVGVVAPGYLPGQEGGSWEKVDLTVRLMGIIFPSVIFLGLSSTTYCILNALKRFATPALGDAFWKVGTVAGLLILYGRFDIYALAIGFVAGAVLKLGTHVVALGRTLLRIRLGMSVRHPAFRGMILLMLPMAFGFAYSEARQLFDIRFASMLSEGAVAALNYSRQVTDMPYQIVAYALGIALFPFLSERASRGQWTDLRSLLLAALRMLLFLFVPVTVAMFLLAEPTLRIVYQSGEFNEESLRLTVPVLEFYALGMLAQALECVLLQTFYSLKNTLVPTLIGFATTILHVLLAWWMVSVLPTDDPRGIALAYTIARTVKVVAVYIPLVLALKGPQLRTQVGFFAQVAIATAAMGAVMWLAYGAVVAAHPMASRKDGLLVFGACVLVGAVAYVTAGALLRIPELDAARRAVRERLARRRAKPEA